MVKFVYVIDAWFVHYNNKAFAVINRNGLFMNGHTLEEPVRLDAKDLRLIAAKVNEVMGTWHDVYREIDENGRPKLVCWSSGCNKASIEMKPGMNVEDWAEARERFLIKHPCERVRKA